MRKFTLLKTMMLAIVLFASSGISAQLLVENFDYTIGTVLTTTQAATPPVFDPVTGWGVTGTNVSDPITVTDGLTFNGYAGSGIGGAANVIKGGEDINKPFTPQTSGTVYTAFLIKTEATNSLGYFFHLGKNIIGTTFFSRIWVNATGDGINVTTSSTAPTTWLPITAGTPVLLVLKHNFTSHNTDLYILNSFSATEPATSAVQIAEASVTEIGSVALRQYAASQRIVVDGIRIGTTWAEAVAPASGTPKVATPSFSPIPGNYVAAQNVTITSTDGSSIYYTLDGSDPDQTKTLYTSPISVSSTTTIKAKAYKTGMDPSTIAIGNYTFPTNVANIAALRAAPLGFYKLTGEAVLTLKTTTRNAKYIQDATGAVLIDDASAKITTTYNLGDGISGIIGTTAFFNSMLQFTPVADPGAPTSTGKTVNSLDLTLTDLINHQAELVKVSGVTISDITSGTGMFVASTSYNLNAATNPVLRTQYADLNYIGQTIPTAAQDIIGVVLVNGTTAQLVPRSLSDMVSTGLSTAKQNLKLFAANGKINFEAAEGETVEVYNTVGQKVLSAAAISGNNTLTVNAKGVVFVKVGNRTGKVIL